MRLPHRNELPAEHYLVNVNNLPVYSWQRRSECQNHLLNCSSIVNLNRHVSHENPAREINPFSATVTLIWCLSYLLASFCITIYWHVILLILYWYSYMFMGEKFYLLVWFLNSAYSLLDQCGGVPVWLYHIYFFSFLVYLLHMLVLLMNCLCPISMLLDVMWENSQSAAKADNYEHVLPISKVLTQQLTLYCPQSLQNRKTCMA